MFSRQLSRFFQSSFALSSGSKSDLAKLRKKTGYTFANCKKALEVNGHDFAKAEQWLKEQAQALGWSKATKLEGRTTAQGLVGLAVRNNSGVIVEVNCETDFVARNNTFKSLVETAAASCLRRVTAPKASQSIYEAVLSSTDLKNVEGPDKKPLQDHAALAISSLGENITLRRALFVTTPNEILIAGYTHPSPDGYADKIMTGKYAALVAYTAESKDDRSSQIAKQLCQHVVGMNPAKVGEVDVDEPAANSDDETVMIHQDFLLDPSMTVGQLIEESGLKIVDFWRYECGEQEQTQDAAEPSKASQAA